MSDDNVKFPPTSTRRKLWKGAFFVVASLVALVAFFYAEEDFRGKWAWEKFKREGEAKGEQFDLAALVPAPVPESQNFALTPLLRPALEFVRGPTGVRWLDTNGVQHLRGLRVDLRSETSSAEFTLAGILERGAFFDLETCRNFYRGNTNYPQRARSGKAAEDILTALSRFDPDLKELQEAAAARPFSRFPVEYTNEMPFAILLPHLAYLKGVCTIVDLRAIARLELGQPVPALADLKLGLRLSDCMREEPLLIDHLVRIATLMLDLQTLREGLLRHAWSDAQLIDVERQLASLDLLSEYGRAMRGERACSVGALEYYRRQGFRSRLGELFESTASINTVWNFMPGGWYRQNMLAICHLHQEFLLASISTKDHRVFPLADGLEESLGKQTVGPYNIFAKLLVPALSNAVRKSARAQTYLDEARMACALERYRLANGRLPESLTDLMPRFTEKIPNDVIDGQALRYRRTEGGGYVVYSVGWNRTDEGGEFSWHNGDQGKPVDIKQGDWVWQMPGK